MFALKKANNVWGIAEHLGSIQVCETDVLEANFQLIQSNNFIALHNQTQASGSISWDFGRWYDIHL